MKAIHRLSLRKYDQNEIDLLVQPIAKRIVSAVVPLKLILFGSACTGDFDEVSDLDFLVVLQTAGGVKAACQTLYRLRTEFSRNMDFICMDFASYEKKSLIGGIAWVASREGRVLFP